MSEVIVVDYDPDWVNSFTRLRDFIASVVADCAESIEHVGSTSVPGLAAKPIIDVDIVVTDSAAAQRAIAALASIGFTHRGDLGVPGREAFTRPPDLPPANVYVVLRDCTAYRNHIALRDYLLARPEAATEYGSLKKALAEKFPNDIDAYIDGKTAFIVEILKECGLQPDELASVEEINKQKR